MAFINYIFRSYCEQRKRHRSLLRKFSKCVKNLQNYKTTPLLHQEVGHLDGSLGWVTWMGHLSRSLGWVTWMGHLSRSLGWVTWMGHLDGSPEWVTWMGHLSGSLGWVT